MATRFQSGLTESAHFREIDELVAPPGFRVDLINTGRQKFFLDRRFLQLENLFICEIAEAAGIARRGECLDDAMSFGVVIAAEQLPRLCGRELRLDQIQTAHARSEYSTLGTSAYRLMHVALGLATFQRDSEAVWGSGSSELLPYHRLCLRGAAERTRLIRIWTQALEYAFANPHQLAQPRISGLLEAECLDALLTCADATHRSAMHKTSRPTGRHGALRRAVAHIDAHIEEPIDMPRLCEVAGTSLRPLEIAFRESLGVTPKAYINLKRLHRARRELRAGDPQRSNVTAIATRWGFFHLGRFAQEYRRLFGESPRSTLNQRARSESLISVPHLRPAPPGASQPEDARSIDWACSRDVLDSGVIHDLSSPLFREHPRDTLRATDRPE